MILRKFGSQTQPLGYFHLAWCPSARDLEMAGRALRGIQTEVVFHLLPLAFTYLVLYLQLGPVISGQLLGWEATGPAYSTHLPIAPWQLDLCCGQGKRCPDVPESGDKDQITRIQPSYVLRLDQHLHCLPVHQLHNQVDRRGMLNLDSLYSWYP